nr:hypothetical protein Itr_chr03CG08070 [Ipomoea trifida]
MEGKIEEKSTSSLHQKLEISGGWCKIGSGLRQILVGSRSSFLAIRRCRILDGRAPPAAALIPVVVSEFQIHSSLFSLANYLRQRNFCSRQQLSIGGDRIYLRSIFGQALIWHISSLISAAT